MGKRQQLRPDIVSTNPSNCTLTKRHTLQLFFNHDVLFFSSDDSLHDRGRDKLKMLVRLKRAIDSGEATTNATPFR